MPEITLLIAADANKTKGLSWLSFNQPYSLKLIFLYLK